MLQLYGNPKSRAMRCLWMLEEMGKPYQLIEKSTRADDLQSPEYLRLNPNARIPTLVDGDRGVVGFNGNQPLPRAKIRRTDALCRSRSFGSSCSVELLGDVGNGSRCCSICCSIVQLLPEFARDASYAERDELLLKKPLGVLNDALAERDYLVGNNFTVADLNVAGILVWGKMGRLNLSGHAEVTRWFDACLARPAYGRVRDRASRK